MPEKGAHAAGFIVGGLSMDAQGDFIKLSSKPNM